MKLKALCATGALALFGNVLVAQTKPYHHDLNVTSVNREAVRSSFITFGTRDGAISGKYADSEYYQLLNGVWKFYYVGYEKDLPAGLTDSNVDTSSWRDIKVPGNWELAHTEYATVSPSSSS